MDLGFSKDSYDESYNPLEKNIVAAMLKRNEVEKSLEIALSVFEREFSEGFLSILNQIYEKDAIKGSQLAEEILKKLKSAKDKKVNSYLLFKFFNKAVESTKQKEKKSLLSEKSLRELAKILGQLVLAKKKLDYQDMRVDYAKTIGKYTPFEASQIRRKFKSKPKTPEYDDYEDLTSSNQMAYPANAPVANVTNASKRKSKKSAKKVETPKPKNEWQLKTEAREAFLQKLRNGKFTKEERAKVIEEAKKFALASNRWGYIRPEGFISVVTELSLLALASSDKEVAEALMKEAEVYVRPETKHYLDYVAKLFLAVGNSSIHPEKSFALMESLASINEIIESAVKLGAFVDVDSTFVPNGEVNAAFFLDDMGMRRGISRNGELQMFIHNLAKADFQRTKGLADKFEKTEFKMTARMLILESLLGEMLEPEHYRGGGIDLSSYRGY